MTILRSRVVTYGIAVVWLMFAILGKLFPITPTHREIVARVFGEALSEPLLFLIGVGELCVAGWILSGVARRWCGWFQIVAVLTMNCIKFRASPVVCTVKIAASSRSSKPST